MRLTYHLAGLVMGLLLLLTAASAQTDGTESGAVVVVEKLHTTLLEIMKNAGKLGFKGRYDIIAPVVEASFDTPLIAQVVLSRYWKELTPAQQGQFVVLFNRLSASTYASRFDSFSGETFKTLGVEAMKKERLLVKTELAKKNDTPVKLEYLVQQNAGKWYIISVIADGVNDLALKRAEYATIINDKGFDHLVGEIEKKIHELETTSSTN
jgi:phospholipid transport system substrate-binding protein